LVPSISVPKFSPIGETIEVLGRKNSKSHRPPASYGKSLERSRTLQFNSSTHEASTFPLSPPKRVAQKFHFAILRIEVTRVSCGLSAIAELLVICRPIHILVLNKI